MRIEKSCGRLLRMRRRRRTRVWSASGKWTARPFASSLGPQWKGVGGGGGGVARGRQKSIGQPPTPAWASGVPLAPPSKASRPLAACTLEEAGTTGTQTRILVANWILGGEGESLPPHTHTHHTHRQTHKARRPSVHQSRRRGRERTQSWSRRIVQVAVGAGVN